MTQPRNPLNYLFVGAVLGGLLGAVVGIAIGSTAGRSAGTPSRVQTVVSTRTVRVLGLAPPVTRAPSDTTPADGTPATTDTTPTDTTTTDKTITSDTTPATAPTPTTSDTTPTDTTGATDTTTAPQDPNDVPPADPNRPPHRFCATHVCAPGFSRGNGYVVQCADGVWTRRGGEPGACRRDGGLA